jgi:hypothetical protein
MPGKPTPEDIRARLGAQHAAAPPASSIGAIDEHTAHQLAVLNAKAWRHGSRLARVNAACFAVMLVLACSWGGLLGVTVIGQVNLGMILILAQGAVLIATAASYDRLFTRECDPLAEELRMRREHSDPAPAAEDPGTDLGWPSQYQLGR